MITVHHLNHSRSQRVLWLLEELGMERLKADGFVPSTPDRRLKPGRRFYRSRPITLG